MKVNMPVEAMGEYCLTCPELDIDIVTMESYKLETVEDGVTKIKVSTYKNNLKCKHCERCRVIFEHEQESKKEEPITEAKKPAAKKTTAKKTTTRKTVTKK